MTARGIHTCCPEAPSTINIVRNVIEMDGQVSFFVNEVYTGADVVDGALTLRHTPYQAAAVQVVLNSGTQVPSRNYQVVGNKILFVGFVPVASDVIHIRSFQVGDNVSTLVQSELPAGSMIGFGGAGIAPPEGWLFMDGTTVVTSAYETLFSFLAENLSLTVEGVVGPSYTLKALNTSYYDGQTFVAGRTIIKT